MRMAERIERKLREALLPVSLSVIDESRLHAGHSGAREGGESHFRVELVSAAFNGRSRLERQRMVHDILREELKGGIHALTIVASPEGPLG